MSRPKRMCRVHKETSPGSVLSYADGRLHGIASDGAHLRLTHDHKGNLVRLPKPNKKQRKALRAFAKLQAPLDARQVSETPVLSTNTDNTKEESRHE